jgi:hypothetical protein
VKVLPRAGDAAGAGTIEDDTGEAGAGPATNPGVGAVGTDAAAGRAARAVGEGDRPWWVRAEDGRRSEESAPPAAAAARTGRAGRRGRGSRGLAVPRPDVEACMGWGSSAAWRAHHAEGEGERESGARRAIGV